jgi:hypothetical protein
MPALLLTFPKRAVSLFPKRPGSSGVLVLFSTPYTSVWTPHANGGLGISWVFAAIGCSRVSILWWADWGALDIKRVTGAEPIVRRASGPVDLAA